MPNYIRVKQLDSQELSGFFTSISVEDIFNKASSGQFVNTTGNQTIYGIKTFADGIDLNDIDNLNLSGVDITITNGNVVLTNPVSAPNLVYNTGNQTISGVKTFATGIFAPNLVYNTGDQTISGVKTFATGIFAPNLVYNTGDQTISGVKTFFNSGIFSTSGVSAVSLLNNPLSIVGSGNSYLQVNIQNRATGTNATADLVITANNGTDSTNFINLGINNSGYNDSNFSNGTGLDGYLFINGGDLDIGTQTPGKNIEFHVGGTTAANAIARITSSGLAMVSGYIFSTVNTGVVAGTDAQGQGPLTSQINIITTNTSPTGAVTLPIAISNFSAKIMVRNATANSLNVYPAAGARINTLTVNNPFDSLINQDNNKEFYSVSTGQWYSI